MGSIGVHSSSIVNGAFRTISNFCKKIFRLERMQNKQFFHSYEVFVQKELLLLLFNIRVCLFCYLVFTFTFSGFCVAKIFLKNIWIWKHLYTSCCLSLYSFLKLCGHVDILTRPSKLQKGVNNFLAFWRGDK